MRKDVLHSQTNNDFRKEDEVEGDEGVDTDVVDEHDPFDEGRVCGRHDEGSSELEK